MTNCSVLKTQIIHIMRRLLYEKIITMAVQSVKLVFYGEDGVSWCHARFQVSWHLWFWWYAGAMMRSPLLKNQICGPLFVFLLVSLWTCSSCKTSPNVSFAYGAQGWTEPRDTGAFFVDTEEINIHSLMVSSANMPFALDKHDYIL